MAVQVLTKRSALLNESRVPHLTEEERQQVAALLARLEEECEADVQRVILYGSKARGDAVQWSDIDLLIVATNETERVKKICYDFQYDNFLVATQIFSQESWEEYKRLKLPFYVNVRRDGIELWDESERLGEESRVPVEFPEGEPRQLDYETIEVIRSYVDEAHLLGREAKLLERDLSVFRALVSAYYSAFNLATAVLYSLNVVRGKHIGIEGAISQFLVKPNLIEEEYKNIYVSLFNARIWSDYKKVKKEYADDLTEEQSTQLLRDAERFNARMEQFLRERGALID